VRERIPRVETFDHDVCFVEYGGEMWQVRVEEERCNILCTCGSMASGTPELNIDIDLEGLFMRSPRTTRPLK